jgi:adenylosuccinate synthase
MRAYATRHGAGPLLTEDRALADILPEPHNNWNDWQRDFRVGYCDLVAARYARDVVGQLDHLAVTHVDYLPYILEWKFCTAYRYQGVQTDLSTSFQHSGNRITALTVKQPPDLAYQERLTQQLQACVPDYQILARKAHSSITPADQANYLALIAEKLSVPIAITSFGPTAEDKVSFLTL